MRDAPHRGSRHKPSTGAQVTCTPAACACASVLGSWGKTMRDAVRNKKRWIGRRTPTQDPSTDLAAQTSNITWSSWYEMRACLDSNVLSKACGTPGTKSKEKAQGRDGPSTRSPRPRHTCSYIHEVRGFEHYIIIEFDLVRAARTKADGTSMDQES